MSYFDCDPSNLTLTAHISFKTSSSVDISVTPGADYKKNLTTLETPLTLDLSRLRWSSLDLEKGSLARSGLDFSCCGSRCEYFAMNSFGGRSCITNSRGIVDSNLLYLIKTTLILIMRLFQTEVIFALWTLSQPLRTNSIAFVLRSYHRPYTLIVKFLSSYAVLVKKTIRTSSRWHVLNSDSQFRFLLNRLWLESY